MGQQVSAVRPESAKAHGAAHVNGPRGGVVANLTKESEQERDRLLLVLLKTPPQPRPKRERGKSKPTLTRGTLVNGSEQADEIS